MAVYDQSGHNMICRSVGMNNLKSTTERKCQSLRDQARLKAISSPHSGGWLRAIPNCSLGLAMTPKFVIALRLRLGISVFPNIPNSIRWTCNYVLAEHGNHALGCGPLRIKRQDALCDIFYHCLLKENSGTRREQRCLTQSFDRPGDIYHPDFTQGRPAYFDVSIRNSFNPSQIIIAANEAGAAAKFGESEKDDRHDENVTACSRRSFLPFGGGNLWSMVNSQPGSH